MQAVITGASRGIGFAVAERFAAGGYDLWLLSQNDAALYHAVEQLAARFPAVTVRAKAFDLSRKEEAIAAGRWALAGAGAPDVLVNNAGRFLPGAIHAEEDGTLEAMIETNLYSAYHFTRALLPAMMARRAGHIFNLCSIASLQAYPNGGSYGISKFALAGFSRNLREELKPFAIKVTAVYPGAVYTDSWAASGVDPARLMTPGDVAEMIFAAASLSPQGTVEDIVLRPLGGDI